MRANIKVEAALEAVYSFGCAPGPGWRRGQRRPACIRSIQRSPSGQKLQHLLNFSLRQGVVAEQSVQIAPSGPACARPLLAWSRKFGRCAAATRRRRAACRSDDAGRGVFGPRREFPKFLKGMSGKTYRGISGSCQMRDSFAKKTLFLSPRLEVPFNVRCSHVEQFKGRP